MITGHHKYSCYKHLFRKLSGDIHFHFFWVNTCEWNDWVTSKCVLTSWRNCLAVSQGHAVSHPHPFPPAVWAPSCPWPCQNSSAQSSGHPARCVAVNPCTFNFQFPSTNFQFPSAKRLWMCLIAPSVFYLVKCLLQSFAHFFTGLFVFFLIWNSLWMGPSTQAFGI